MNSNMPANQQFAYLGLVNGHKMNLADPEPDLMSIGVIANSLSKQCRFGGQLTEFYSVAQHSVFVSHLVPPEYAFIGLMHDATEAFCVDLPKPIKQLLPTYDMLEDLFWKALCRRYNLPQELPAEVHHADIVAVKTEARDLQNSLLWKSWYPDIPPSEDRVIPMTPREAGKYFLDRYVELTDPQPIEVPYDASEEDEP